MLATLLRYLLLFSSRLAGAVRRLLRHGLVLNLVLIIGIAAWLSVADRFRIDLDVVGGGPQEAGFTPWLTTWNVLSVWAFLLVVWWVLEVRQQLVVDSFEDFSGGDAEAYAKSFGVLLVQELASLNSLFNEFDEGRQIQATPDPLEPLEVTFQVESIGQFLNQAVSSETSFSIGPFKVPVGVIAGLVGRLVQGPRLSGQLHRQGTRQIVTAQLVGRFGNRSWRLEEDLDAGDGTGDPITQTAHRLACSIFADMVLRGGVRPRALEAFVKSLNAYRSSLHSERGQRLRLQDAERALLESIDNDANFDLAYYNLGVVYTELDQLEAAGKAFTAALRRNNRRWSYYYALARNYYDRGVQAPHVKVAVQQWLKGVDHCDRSIRLAQQGLACAQAINLKTLTQLNLANKQYDLNELVEASRTARRAARWSWLAMCEAEFNAAPNQTLERIRNLTGTCLLNLATILHQWGYLIRSEQTQRKVRSLPQASRAKIWFENYVHGVAVRKAIWSLRLAQLVTPSAADIHQLLGRVLMERGSAARAIRPLRVAARVNPTSANPWGFLALAYASRDEENKALLAFSRVLEDPSTVDSESLSASSQAMTTLSSRLDDVESFLQEARNPERHRNRTKFFIWFMPRYMKLAYRLAGRRLRGQASAGQVLTAGLKDPEALKANLDSQRKRFKSASERAQSLRDVQQQARSLREKGEEGIEPLKKMLKEKEAAGFEWEYGEVADRLGQLQIRIGRYKDAEQTFRTAIERLQNSQANEIQRRGLHALLARALRRQERPAEALEEAIQAVELDPVGAYERTELGWAYFALAEYELAREAWEDALVWNPNDAQLHHYLGLCLLIQMDDTKTKTERAARQEKATRYLQDALDLYPRTATERDDARFLLARSYGEAGRYRDQVRELRTLERIGNHPLFVKIQLADAHLGNQDLSEAESRFKAAAAEIEGMLGKKRTGVNDVLSAPAGEELTLGAALAFAHLGVAASLSEREVHLDEARAEVGRARKAIEKLKDQSQRGYWSGHCDLFEGEILLRQQKIDEAVTTLEAALASNPTSQSYCRLAQALARKLELGVPDTDSVPIARRALRYCEEARRLDWTDSYKEELDTVAMRLSSWAESGAAGP